MEKVTSTSIPGRADIAVTFARETDMDFARMELSERLASLRERLPVGSTPPLVSPYVPDEYEDQTRPLLSYTVTGPYTLETIREYVLEEIVPELELVNGVGVIDVRGGRARILEIELDRARIQALELTPQQVVAAVRRLEIVAEAGAVFTDRGTLRTLAIRETPPFVQYTRHLRSTFESLGIMKRSVA